ncbi:hypothetical protein QBC36DRAFT_46483 [Triangularia setosa]|uniref:Secreted protein n=1 Tax=Triangularia setosa TaxID=2587417 RepID=A0AAN7AAG6_9PEZI|nr:hypothetical protein QBC36DRAFT_46483 [Podospora setosa]
MALYRMIHRLILASISLTIRSSHTPTQPNKFLSREAGRTCQRDSADGISRPHPGTVTMQFHMFASNHMHKISISTGPQHFHKKLIVTNP